MAEILGTESNEVLTGGSGIDTIDGGGGNDIINSGAGNDIIDGGSGSDRLNGGSGSDTLIYTLTENYGATDVYTGGSGRDTILLQLTQAQWTDAAVRVQLQNYVEFLQAVKMNPQGEVSNGIASDFVFTFTGGTKLTVQMMEQLAISVQEIPGGPYVPVDYLAALITGSATGTVVEAGGVANGTPGTPTANGDLYADDLNGTDDVFQAVAAGADTSNHYGTYGVTAAGVWTYTLDNTNAAVQALNVGSPALSDSFTVYSEDGTAKVVTVTINGSNDAAVITGTSSGIVTEAGGNTVGIATATGDLLATDVDNSLDTFQAVSALALSASGYGHYTVTTAGQWEYILDNSNAIVNALNTGGTLGDSFVVYSADGTAKTVNILINGTTDTVNLSPTDISLSMVAPSGNGLPGADVNLGTLSTIDPDNTGGYTYSILSSSTLAGTAATFAISGNVLKTVSGLAASSTYELDIQTADSAGGTYHEIVNIITGSNNNESALPTSGAVAPILVGDDVLYGAGGSDYIYGGSGNDTLFGQGANDYLYGGAGSDTLSGGNNQDTFAFMLADLGTGVDTITDFTAGPLNSSAISGDVLDISDLLVGYGPASNIADFVHLVVNGSNTTVQIDRDGAGSTYSAQDLVVLQNVTGLNVTSLLANGNIDPFV